MQSLCFAMVWTNLNNPFTAAFWNELQKKLLYNLALHLKSVATLLHEIWTTIQDSHLILKSFMFSKHLQGCHGLDHMSMPIHLHHAITMSSISIARTHASSYACQSSMDASMTHCSRLSQAVNRCCCNLLHWCDVRWHQCRSGKTIKLKQIYQTEIWLIYQV